MPLVETVGTKCRWIRLNLGLRYGFAAIFLCLGPAEAFTQCADDEIFVLKQRLTASDVATDDGFGGRVCVSGDAAVVSSGLDDCAAGSNCGSAYVYRFNGIDWVEEQKLTASDEAESDEFGISVSLSGDTAVVGAPKNDDVCPSNLFCESGSAYIFRFNGISWVEEQKLTASDAAADDHFGISVSLSGATAVVGASFDFCESGIACGSAYVFRFDGTSWVEEQKLTASDAAWADLFGGSVAVSGETAVMGAQGDDCSAGDDCGAAYVFRFNGNSWIEEQKLTASDAEENDLFGSIVSVSGETIVVGVARDDCAAGQDCGSVYVFRFNGTVWVEEQKLTASDAAEGHNFGSSVSVSGETILVASPRDRFGTGLPGSVYVFRFNGTTWVEEQKLTAANADVDAGLVGSVSLDGDRALVGASLGDCEPGRSCRSVFSLLCVSAPTVVNLDIKPGSCPNPVNPKSKGVVPVALVGSSDFDVTTIDPDSLALTRSDGVGESVTPLSGRRGPKIVIEDVVTPLGDEPCTCHELGGDGMDDLSLKFSTSAMSQALQLDESIRGATVKLVLRGTLFDGTTFEAVDCIEISGTGQAFAQCTEEQKLAAIGAQTRDLFGRSVSVSGDTAVVGADGDSCVAGIECGAAYVFRFNGTEWFEEQKLVASDAAAKDKFGFSVSVSGDTAVVGALRDDCGKASDCGSAYVFRFNGTSWVEEQKLTAAEAAANDHFGRSVSVSGETVVIGAQNVGAAYVFRFNGVEWVDEQKLTASDAGERDGFGWSVSVSGDSAVVGAWRDNCATGSNCGSAYLYRFNGIEWVEQQKLTASDAEAGDRFGWSVAISGETAIVGAFFDDCAAGSNCGSAYVYRFNGIDWVGEQKLTASDTASGDLFGFSVSVSGEMVVVGSYYDDCAAGDDCGSAYVFRLRGTSWVEERKLTASDAARADVFGWSVSVSGGTAVVGALNDDCAVGFSCGSAHVFRCALLLPHGGGRQLRESGLGERGNVRGRGKP